MKETIRKAGDMFAAVRELQGLNVSLITGGAANTKYDLAAIRDEDTVVAAINNNAGTLTDITANVSIAGLKATGTITLTTPAVGNTVTVDGVVFTAVAADAVVASGDDRKWKIGTDTVAAANLAAAINRQQGNSATSKVRATSALGVVTLTAMTEGAGGNAVTLTKVGAPIAVSAATLANGGATGGVKSTSITNQIVLFWFNKR